MVKTKFVGLVDRITIEHDNTGILPDWNLDKVLTLPSQYEKITLLPSPTQENKPHGPSIYIHGVYEMR